MEAADDGVEPQPDIDEQIQRHRLPAAAVAAAEIVAGGDRHQPEVEEDVATVDLAPAALLRLAPAPRWM